MKNNNNSNSDNNSQSTNNNQTVVDENSNYNSNKNPIIDQRDNEYNTARSNINYASTSDRNKTEGNHIEHYNSSTQVNSNDNNAPIKQAIKQSPSFEKRSAMPSENINDINKKIIQIERSKPSKSPETLSGKNINYYSNNTPLSSKNNYLYKPIPIPKTDRNKPTESIIKPTDSSSKIVPTSKYIIKTPMVYIPHQKQFHIKTDGNCNVSTTTSSLRNYSGISKHNSNTPKLLASNRIQILYKKK